MNHEEQKFNQRKSYRCPIADEQQTAELKVGRRRIRVRLFNESSGGFGAVSQEKIDAAPGDILQLTASGGSFEVRVAYLRSVEPAECEGGTLYRLGLERLHDGEPRPTHASAHAVGAGPSRTSSHVPLALVGLLLITASGGFILWKTGVGKWLPGKGATSLTQPTSNPALTKTIRQIGLTRHQQGRLEQVASQTAKTLQEIDELWKNDSPEDRQAKQALLLEAAKQEIYGLLTDEQRTRWKAFVQ